MTVLDIVVAGNPVLRLKAEPVKKFDRKLGTLLDDMAETMYKAEGVGIAAPQVSVSLRAVVIDVGEGAKYELINPQILMREDTVIYEEGCLSVPEFEGEVERSRIVGVEYYDRKGRRQYLKADGLLAVAVQHEMDHLDGILFIDKAKVLKPKEQK